MKFELKPNNRHSSDEDLINDLVDVGKKLCKTTITRNEYDKHGRYSEGTLRRRFGGWLWFEHFVKGSDLLLLIVKSFGILEDDATASN